VLASPSSCAVRGTDAWAFDLPVLQGAVANFVESEQLVTLDNGSIVASFVQLRGSIPLLWTQLPNIKYKPPTKILDGAAASSAFDAHVDDLVQRYQVRTLALARAATGCLAAWQHV